MNAKLQVVEHLDGPPSPPPSPLSETERREALRIAIENRSTADVRRAKANAALDKAEALLAESENELRLHDDLDDQIARGRADAIAASLASGAAPLLDTPKELAELVKRQAETRNRIAAVKSAVAKLRADAEAANQEYEEADQAVRNAALVTMASGAEALIKKMLAHEEKAAALRKRVSAYQMQRRQFFGLKQNGVNQFLPLTTEHGKALRQQPKNVGFAAEADHAASALWREMFTKLLDDADAPFDALK